ncbi:MAG: threonine/serine exporter family protein [bacterium]|nr:threonine/serine exporter family protein [bacterium]
MPTVDPRIDFLIALGRALHENGIPAHRLEDTLSVAARRLDLRAEFFSTPTSLISAFGEPGSQQTSLARVTPGEMRLDRIVALDEVVEALWRGEISVEQAHVRLRDVATSPSPYGPALSVVALATASGTAALVFGTGAGRSSPPWWWDSSWACSAWPPSVRRPSGASTNSPRP